MNCPYKNDTSDTPSNCKRISMEMQKKERPAISRRSLHSYPKPTPIDYIKPATDFWARVSTLEGKIPM
jgi:hypothetical protein